MSRKNQPEPTASTITKGVAKKSALLAAFALPAVIAIGLLQGPGGGRPWFLAASVLFGGALGLVNFRWLAMAVQQLYHGKGAAPTVSNIFSTIVSVFKLSVIFIVLFLVIKGNVFSPVGLAAGLSLSFLAIVWEGLVIMGRKGE
jgi:hypothetical protein